MNYLSIKMFKIEERRKREIESEQGKHKYTPLSTQPTVALWDNLQSHAVFDTEAVSPMYLSFFRAPLTFVFFFHYCLVLTLSYPT